MAGNKNVISAGLENVGQDHCLQKTLYHGSYSTDFKPNFHQNDVIGAGDKRVTSVDLANGVQGHISQRIISQLLSNRFEPNILHESLNRNCHINVCRPHFLTRDNCLLHGCTPQTSHLFAVHHSSFILISNLLCIA